VRVASWLSPTLIVLAVLIALAAALIGSWWLVVIMAGVVLGQALAIRSRRRR
jgi:hypothetical protein